MYVTLLRLYKTGKLTETGLVNAVKKGWINEAQKEKIMED